MDNLETLTEEQKSKIENFYDFYSPKVIALFSKMMNNEIEKVKNEYFYSYYEHIIESSAILLKEMGIIDPITASAVIHKLLWNGYFSKDKSLIYGKSDRINNFGAFGADVVRGRSVCLNNADFEANVLKTAGYEAYIMGARINPKEEIKFKYRPRIKRHIDKTKNFWDDTMMKLIEFTPLRNIGNHAVTLIRIKDHFVISDSTSLAFANIDAFMKATYVSSNGGFTLKPWLMLMAEELTEDNFKRIIDNTIINSDRVLLNPQQVRQSYETGIALCHQNKYLLEDFHEEIKYDIDVVSHTLAKVKR